MYVLQPACGRVGIIGGGELRTGIQTVTANWGLTLVLALALAVVPAPVAGHNCNNSLVVVLGGKGYGGAKLGWTWG